MGRVTLERFTQNDFKIFKSWLKSEREVAIFAGPIFNLPIDDEQLTHYLNIEGIQPYRVVLNKSKKVIGHCELNFNHKIPRLSRILIGDTTIRGLGIGREIVLKMATLLFQDDKVMKVDLNVFDFNHQAIKCYQNVGFKMNEITTKSHQFRHESWTRLNMILSREDFELEKSNFNS